MRKKVQKDYSMFTELLLYIHKWETDLNIRIGMPEKDLENYKIGTHYVAEEVTAWIGRNFTYGRDDFNFDPLHELDTNMHWAKSFVVNKYIAEGMMDMYYKLVGYFENR